MACENSTRQSRETASFDPSRHRLGRLCRRGHDYCGTGKSLGFLSSNACTACARERNQRPEILAKQRAYRKERYRDTSFAEALKLYMRNWQKGRGQAPEIKARKNEREKRRRQDPAIRERRRARSRDRERRRREHPSYRLQNNISRVVRKSIRTGKQGRSWRSILPFTLAELVAHLEAQFAPGMNWANYGSHWHIDHIIPISAFVFVGPDDPSLRVAWSLSNLRPLEKTANLVKQNRLILRC